MDEYIPQLTLTPDLNAQPQPEVKQEADLITKAQAAPEAGPDLSALSEQEQQAVLAFSKQIDLENAQQILEYGASAQKNIADFSDTALAKVKTGDLGEIGDMLSGLLVELKTMDEPEKNRGPVPQGKDQRRGDEEPLRDGGGQCRPHLRRAGKAQDHAAEGRSRDGSDVRAEPTVLQGADHVYSGR